MCGQASVTTFVSLIGFCDAATTKILLLKVPLVCYRRKASCYVFTNDNIRCLGTINCDGLNVNWDDLFSLPKEYWMLDAAEIRKWAEEQVRMSAIAHFSVTPKHI